MESLKGKLTEEEAKYIMEKLIYHWNSGDNIDQLICLMKQCGWTKQNPVEKAKELYYRYSIEKVSFSNLEETQHKAIEYLEQQLKEKQ